MKNEKTAKTYIEKLGFKDDDLYEKNHDELMEFLVNNKLALLKYISEKTGMDFIPGSEKLELEYCIMNKNYVNGFIDLFLTYQYYAHSEFINNPNFLIEVKTKINSFGGVLRELNYYKSTFEKYSWVILFSNDDRYRKLFEEQGILFITEKDINDIKTGMVVEIQTISTIVKYAQEKEILISDDCIRLLDLNDYKKILDKLSEEKIVFVCREDINNLKKEGKK